MPLQDEDDPTVAEVHAQDLLKPSPKRRRFQGSPHSHDASTNQTPDQPASTSQRGASFGSIIGAPEWHSGPSPGHLPQINVQVGPTPLCASL